jgi:hypothetical protein
MNNPDHLAPLRFRFHDATKVRARLTELGFDSTLIEAECVRTHHSSSFVLKALSGADLNSHDRLFLGRVLGDIKRHHTHLQALGQPLPELPRRRYERRPRTDHAAQEVCP